MKMQWKNSYLKPICWLCLLGLVGLASCSSAGSVQDNSTVNHLSNSEPDAQLVKTRESYLKLVSPVQTNAFGNTLYELKLWHDGELVASYRSVTGRAHTQKKKPPHCGK